VKAVVLVGGEGTRLRPLTYLTVKAMVPVLNRPFIEYTIKHLSQHHIKEIVLAIGYKPDRITRYLTNEKNIDAKLLYSIETQPLGTAGAVKNAEKYVDGRIFAMNGDIFTDLDFTEMLRFHDEKGAKVTIALTPVEDPTRFGVVETDNDSRVTRFVEKPRREEVTGNMINAGVYIIEAEVLKRIPQGQRCMFEHDIFPALLEDGEPVFGYTTKAYWMDMGTPEKYLELNGDLLHGKSQQVTFNTNDVRINPKSSIHPKSKLTGPIVIDKQCILEEGVELKGPIVMGSGCKIGEGAIIENSVMWQNVTIGTNAILKDSIVASDSCIDNNAQILEAVIAHTEKWHIPLSGGRLHGRKH
jgi:mannose-1-phosphate guanylyltransferase